MTIIIWWPGGLCCFYELSRVPLQAWHWTVNWFAKLHYTVCLWLCMCCSFRRDIDAMRCKFLSKNKCNYLQHHFVQSVRNYKLSMNNKNNGMPGKLQSNNQVTASQDWVILNLVENLILSVRWCRRSPPPVTAGRNAAAAGKKHPARRRRLIKTGADYYLTRSCSTSCLLKLLSSFSFN